MPLVVRTDLPQLFATVIVGVAGKATGAAVPEAEALTQPFADCVTLKVPLLVTVIDDDVAPLDHSRPVPVEVNTDEPQLLDTETTGAASVAIGVAIPEPAVDVHPLTV